MSQVKNEFHASMSTNIINDPKVKDMPQLYSESTNVVKKESEDAMNKIQFVLVVFSLALAVFLSALDQTIVATALPAIALEFKAFDEIMWIATTYLITE
ncbi:6911_t:CDS:2, partial [Racocetra persica]